MSNRKTTLCIAITCALIVALQSCAPSYKAILPATLKYQNLSREQTKYPLDVAIDRQVLANSGNNKYQKRALKKNLGVYMVKITNTTNAPIALNQQDIVLSDLQDREMRTVPGSYVKQQIKGTNGLYFLWSFLWLFIGSTSSSSNSGSYGNSSNSNSNVIPIPIGFFIGLGNFIGAQQAAKNLESGLSSKETYPLTIEAGKTGYLGLYVQDPAATSGAFRVTIKKEGSVVGKADF